MVQWISQLWQGKEGAISWNKSKTKILISLRGMVFLQNELLLANIYFSSHFAILLIYKFQ